MGIQIYPSLMAAPLLHLQTTVETLQHAGCAGLHIDIMDGHFVPNLTMGPDFVRALKNITTLPLDVHLMVEKPELWIQPFAQAGAEILTFHLEATVHAHRLCQSIQNLGVQVGIAINPSTPWQHLCPVLPFVNQVLVMAVNPGFSRQTHIVAVHEKISELHHWKTQKQLTFAIQVDGGVNTVNAPTLRMLGATRLVAGGAIFDTPDWQKTITTLSGV